ncbi:MAG TPA: sigma-70 family RNA polymerase sigma factor [Solirubrobacteraceae bacterium]|nr:sigma-70 family RNA polymerase sigma factor [Solirubrobacteraceae bacterium]
MERSTDTRLVADFRAGHEDAFSEVVRRYGEPLRRYAAQRLRDTAHDPEDIVQESLARAYTALRRDDRPMLLRSWLYAIVRNGIVDALRAPAHSQLHDAMPVGDETFSDVLARIELRAILGSFAELPERQRRALVLRTFEGRPYSAIADELDTSVAATKALIARARSGVRDARLAA